MLSHLSAYFTVRRLKRFAIGCISVLVLFWLYRWLTREPPATSAIGCKSKLAQIIFPDAANRKAKLDHLGYDVQELEDLYYNYVSTQASQCYQQQHLGSQEDGGWEVCTYQQYNIREPCLVYSFGLGDDWNFEKDIEKKFGCEVHAFDPSLGMESHQYSEKGYFHNYGIHHQNSWAVKNTWELKKLDTIMKELGHTGRTIDYLKMDVEFSEWPALYYMLEKGLINNVRQLAIETHTPEVDIHNRYESICTWSTRDTLAAMVHIMMHLQNAGMQLYYTRTNYRTHYYSGLTRQARYCCHNLHFVNVQHPQHRTR